LVYYMHLLHAAILQNKVLTSTPIAQHTLFNMHVCHFDLFESMHVCMRVRTACVCKQILKIVRACVCVCVVHVYDLT